MRVWGNEVRVAALALLLGAIGAQPVLAQDEPENAAYQAEAQPTQSFNKMVQSLIVTARRQDERLQQVPIALTAFSSEDLERSGALDLGDIAKVVPNLLLDEGIAQSSNPRTQLRGLFNNQTSSAADPVIGIYVDGVYRTRTQGSLVSLFDVDRVEVLRGPQGALFGKNSVGGAINISTRAPEFDLGGYAQVRVGNFNAVETEAALNIPLVPEKAAARFSLVTSSRDGYGTNKVNGDDLNDGKLLGGRGQLLFLPADNIEARISFEATEQNRRGLGIKCKLAPSVMPSGLPAILVNNPDIGFRDACADDDRRDELSVASDFSNVDRLRTRAATARVTWDISPQLTLTSISGWRRQKGEVTFDVDGTATPLAQFQNDDTQDTTNQFSQEFQLSGISQSGRLRWVGGLYALSEEANESEFFGLGFEPIIDPMTGQFMVGANGQPMVRRNSTLTRNQLKTDNSSYAVYGQATYSITEKLDFTFGARLTKDRKRTLLDTRIGGCAPGAQGAPCRALRGTPGDRIGQPVMGPMSFTGFERSARFDDITPNASLSYAFSDDVLAYISYATGFQSGGFDGRAASDADANELDNQENTNYEVGLKSSWFQNRLILNGAYYYNVLSKGTRIPIPRVTDSGQIAQSQQLSGRALVRGGELEIAAVPTDNLQLRASLGVARAEITGFNRGEAAGIDSGKLPAVPNYTMNFMLDYERPVGTLGTLGLNAAWSHRGKQNPTAEFVPELDVGKYGLLDGRVSWEMPDGRTKLTAYGTNLLDRRYFFSGFVGFANVVRFFGPPRMYGVEVRRDF